jgi:hypothetical protein
MIRVIVAASALAFGLIGVQAQAATTTKSKTTHSKTAKSEAPAEVNLPPADGDQTAAAGMVYLGHYNCEFSQSVNVKLDDKHPGYVDVAFGKNIYTMKPVLSSTGALRLEDVRGKTLLLQIAYKSMLMDVQGGRRLVDDCVSEKQLEAKRAAAGAPQQALLSGPVSQ